MKVLSLLYCTSEIRYSLLAQLAYQHMRILLRQWETQIFLHLSFSFYADEFSLVLHKF